jgi:hypothetical protein
MSGLTGDQLIYGPINGEDSPGYPVGLAASQTFTRQGGCFVFMSSGYATVCTSSTATIFGWANVGHLNNDSTFPYVSNATNGVDIASVILASDCVFRLPPSTGTFAVTNIGTRYDLNQTTISGIANCQGVALGTSSHQLVIVVGGDLVNNHWVDVIMSPAVRGI